MQKSKTRPITPKPTKRTLPLKGNFKKAKDNESMEEWRHINWRKLERYVFKLQKRIYKASRRGDVKAIRRLQKTLMKSWYARCIAALAAKLAGGNLRQSLQAVGFLKIILARKRQEWTGLNPYPQKRV